MSFLTALSRETAAFFAHFDYTLTDTVVSCRLLDSADLVVGPVEDFSPRMSDTLSLSEIAINGLFSIRLLFTPRQSHEITLPFAGVGGELRTAGQRRPGVVAALPQPPTSPLLCLVACRH